ncbi:DUF2232 domain-containing protein [Azospirillum sp. RWY-5-1]|uniref:DUF2232 domain-containing protein n=1 Tax=Azospirillum oleiclasticum TaxID=2735135 RepID=A0ABX2T490_9PROT|nr:DUF2232 domain-containing protein [Azospirillum oleiclasticum]NYZ11979.1 DUF2232 domain-containing protein [Azospirillum oleiclasticum]NYZ19139.1 DUF2232 domain-containing protein [Azospirillum oleiclasticum]
MHTALAAAVGGGFASALFYLSVLFGGFGALILGYLTPLPLLAAGLSLGLTAALVGSVAGAVMVLGVSGSLTITGAYALTAAVPAVFTVRQALLARPRADGGLEWYPPGMLLTGLTGLGILGFVGAVALAVGEPGGLEGVVRRALGDMAAQFAPPDAEPSADTDHLWIAPALPGFVVVSWMFMTIINGTLAQGVLMRFGRNRRPGMRITELELPRWLGPVYGTVVAMALAIPGDVGFLALNLGLILSVPFAFAGLSVVHAYARARSTRTAILVAFYMFLVLFGWPVVVLVGLGMIEQWMGLRRRWTTGPRQEDE